MVEVDDLHLGSIQLDIKNENWPLVISFAGLVDQFEFRKSLGSKNYNVIYLRDLKHNWYLNGIPGVGDSVEKISEFLKAIVEANSFPHISTIGVSAGGFGALLFGAKLHADKILAFMPQTFVNKLNRFIYWDRRWKDRIIEIYNGDRSNRKFLDLVDTIESCGFSGEMHLFFDQTHRLDSRHSTRLTGGNIKHHAYSTGGHSLVKELRNTGELELILNKLL